ncbi:MAG: hypothetical protein ACLU3N_09445 [Lachnospiraceae bacterium]
MSTVQDYCESSVSDAMGSGATYDAEQFSDYILSQNDYTMRMETCKGLKYV